MGKKQDSNELIRARGTEPPPGAGAGIKNAARYIARAPALPIAIRNPDKYLHSCARQMVGLQRIMAARNSAAHKTAVRAPE